MHCLGFGRGARFNADPQQDAAADVLASGIGVKAAHSFAIKAAATIEVAVPRGLPPREHPGQTERRRRERIRADGRDIRTRIWGEGGRKAIVGA